MQIMGGVNSKLTLPEPTGADTFFALSFHRPDKIKIVLADKPTIEIIRRACFDCWSRGFETDKQQTDGSYHLKFIGQPFSVDPFFPSSADSISSGFQEAVESKQLATRLLMDLRAAGWQFSLSSDLTQDLSLFTWFFHRDHPGPVPRGFCLSLSSDDTLQVIGADNQIDQLVQQAVLDSYPPGLQQEIRRTASCYELKLIGTPWYTNRTDTGVWARKLLLEIIRRLRTKNWSLYATGQLKSAADSLFFINESTFASTHDDQFYVLSLNSDDLLRLIDCPDSVISATRSIIQQVWPPGLKDESKMNIPHANTYEFQLFGKPWLADDGDAVASRAFLNRLFQALLACGLCVTSSLDISRRLQDTSIFILRSCRPSSLPHFCLSLNHMDKIRLIDAPEDMVRSIRRVVSENWPIQICRDYYGSYEIILEGYPWDPKTSTEKMFAKVLICRLLAEFSDKGWRVVSSADVSVKFIKETKIDVHSWILVRVGETQPGSQAVGPGEMAPRYDGAASTPPPSYEEVMKEL